ncbi:hydrogen gas-evolving membrane-bound hydrogenase subunit E [Nocardioides lacusdianchii]|uniref:hydrogen gas-evolving membrane-bound hydrogenase subunit E n=1 Tax=Nocardioides lacusdianchii TaxID=2783664 RepID=UPI001CCAB4A8|nr:hydrogen gas-evolving membrane-bound hydrogenase subunit E [Nocardioides lacusdianchii]
MLLALSALTVLAVLAPLLARLGLGRELGYVFAAGFAGVAILIAFHVPQILDGGTVETSMDWLPSLGVSFALRLNGLSSLFALMVLGVGALIMAYCPRYLSSHDPHGAIYGLLTLFAAAMLGLVLAADVVLLFVFWEATTYCSFLLLGLAGGRATRPARRALLITAAGGLALLVAVVLLTVVTGSTAISDILADREVILASPLALPIGALIAFAAFTKSAQVPLHFWLPGAMVAMTPVSAFLHAATMVKAGVYLLMLVSPIFSGVPAWSALLVSIGLTSALWGAFMALRQHDLKAILAHSTVSQLGLLVAAIGVGTPIALAAAMLHTIAHALFKATLFMLVGIIDKEAGSRDIRELSGLWRVMPVTATMTALAGLSMAGIVPMLGFVSKEYLFQGIFQADFAPAAGLVAGSIAVAASALTTAYGLRIVYGAFGGSTHQPGLYEPSPAFLAPAAIAALAGLVLGAGIDLLNPLVARAGADVVPGEPLGAFQFWHGLSPEIVMSVIAFSSGLMLFLRRHQVDRLLDRVVVPDAGAAFDRAHAGLIAFGYRVGQPDRAGGTMSHLVRPLGGVVFLAAVGFVTLRNLPPVRPADTVGDWVVVGLFALGVAAAVVARDTLAAVAALGFVGLLMAALFVTAGAPDVALTLVLVEVLTAVVVVWVLRRLPARLPTGDGPRLPWSVLLALACGLAAASATYALTGRRGPSTASSFFLDNAEAATGGTNVVNTILVDFRAMDTLGEAVVLGAVALGLLALLGSTAADDHTPEPPADADHLSAAASVFLQVSARLVVPGAALVAAYLLYVGHDAPGGGFIAALVAGVAAATHQIAHGRLPRWSRPELLVGSGILVSLGTGLLASAKGEAVLAPFKLPGLDAVGVGSALLFDIGVMLMVLGMLTAALDRFAARTHRPESSRVHP